MNTCAGSVAEAPLRGQSRFKYRSTEMFSSHQEFSGFKKRFWCGVWCSFPHQWRKADAALENYTEPAEHQGKWQYWCVTVSFKLQLFLDKNVFEYLQYCLLLSLWEVQHSLTALYQMNKPTCVWLAINAQQCWAVTVHLRPQTLTKCLLMFSIN